MWGDIEHRVNGENTVGGGNVGMNRPGPPPVKSLPDHGWQCDSCAYSTGYACGLGLSQLKQQESGKPCQYFARY